MDAAALKPGELIHFLQYLENSTTSSYRARRMRPWQSFIRGLHG